MKLIKKYITKEFSKIALLISTSLIIVYMVIDIFENLGDLTETHTDFITIIEYLILRIPQGLYYIIPLSLLFTSFLTMAIFTKYNETIAMRSGGLSLMNITSPVLAITLIASVFVFFLNDSVIPSANMRAEEIERRSENKPREMFFKGDSLWLKSDNYKLYNIRFIDPEKKILWRINIYSLDPYFQIRESISANKAVSEGGHWFLESGIKRVFDSNEKAFKVYPFERIPLSFPFELKDVRHAVVSASETRFSVLKDYIEKVKKEGYDVKRLSVDLYSKTSFPFAGFIMSIIGISLAMRLKRYGGIAIGIGLCIFASLLYWVAFSMSINLGYSGYIPPVLSAWLVNIIFTGIGGFIFFNVAKI